MQAREAELDQTRKPAKPQPAVPATPAPAKPEIKIFRLRNGSAEEIAITLSQLFESSPAPFPGARGVVATRLRIATHASTNSILVQATADDLAMIEAVIVQLDDVPATERKKPTKPQEK